MTQLNIQKRNSRESKAESKPVNFFARFWKVFRRTKNIFFAPTTPLRMKTGLTLGFLYCLSPLTYSRIDTFPGVMDDLGLAALLITWANRFALPEEASQTDDTNKTTSALPR